MEEVDLVMSDYEDSAPNEATVIDALPTAPDQAANPTPQTTPVTPATPAVPSAPATPVTPAAPVTPATPATPATPVTTEDPNDPWKSLETATPPTDTPVTSGSIDLAQLAARFEIEDVPDTIDELVQIVRTQIESDANERARAASLPAVKDYDRILALPDSFTTVVEFRKMVAASRRAAGDLAESDTLIQSSTTQMELDGTLEAEADQIRAAMKTRRQTDIDAETTRLATERRTSEANERIRTQQIQRVHQDVQTAAQSLVDPMGLPLPDRVKEAVAEYINSGKYWENKTKGQTPAIRAMEPGPAKKAAIIAHMVEDAAAEMDLTSSLWKKQREKFIRGNGVAPIVQELENSGITLPGGGAPSGQMKVISSDRIA